MGVRIADRMVHRRHGAMLMCGRYASFLPAEAVARLFHTVNPLPNFPPTWNMAPTQDAMVVRHLLKWGLLPYFTKDPVHARRPINARAETVATSGMFKSAFARRRCIVPADAFYEWTPVEDGKQPYAAARQHSQPIAFAGLWEGFKFPDGTVILEPVDWPTWSGEVADDPAGLLRPAGDDVLMIWPMSKQVNSPRNNDAEWLEAVE